MGNNLHLMSEEPKQQVWVKTRYSERNIKNLNIFLIFYGESGEKSKTTQLKIQQCSQGQLITLMNEDGTPFPVAETKEIELWRDDSGPGVEWFCDLVTVFNLDTGHSIPFPVQRWIEPKNHYRIRAFDTCLPEDDPYPEQRIRELEYKKRVYLTYPIMFIVAGDESYSAKLIKNYAIPKEEEFPDYIQKRLEQTIFKSSKTYVKIRAQMMLSKWNKFEDLNQVFCIDPDVPPPRSLQCWQEDEWFAAMRLMGQNPVTIKLCTKIPDKFPLIESDVKPLLEGDSLDSLIAENRLFIIDLAIMEGLPTNCVNGQTLKMVAPIALFFMNKKKTLMPLAIQLNQQSGPDNPIFTPLDDKNVWTLAKMWFGNADSNYQAPFVHLCRTHLVVESIGVVTHRNLAPNHPVFRLLAQHLHGTMAINYMCLFTLLSKGGTLDSYTNIRCKGSLELIKKGWKDFKMNIQGTLPHDLEDRGVMDKNVLPIYPYRDDGMLVYDAIKNYVSGILNIYYGKNPEKLKNDKELMNWIKQLNAPISQAGSGIMGLPTFDEIINLDQLILFCTTIIFNCTAQHSVVNDAQHDIFSYLPNMPLQLLGNPPTKKDPVTECDLMKHLPDLDTTLRIVLIMRLLSTRLDNQLGEWDIRHQFDLQVLQEELKLRQELASVSEEITRRNKNRNEYYKYTCLNPKFLPNSINI